MMKFKNVHKSVCIVWVKFFKAVMELCVNIELIIEMVHTHLCILSISVENFLTGILFPLANSLVKIFIPQVNAIEYEAIFT